MRRIPCIRRGEAYYSVDQMNLIKNSGFASNLSISVVNSGLIRKDILSNKKIIKKIRNVTSRELIHYCKSAADIFKNGTINFGDFVQNSDEFVKDLCELSHLPISLCESNINKIYFGLKNIEKLLAGLMRHLPFEFLDQGEGFINQAQISYHPVADNLGVVLPNNSPGVNTLWLPAIPLKTPVYLRPGSDEPLTPFRIMAALIQVGCPKELFNFYPSEHDGSREITNLTDRSMLFGDRKTVEKYKHNSSVQVHGPGYSKIYIGADFIDQWESFLPMIEDSMISNSGRSCINASTLVVPKYAKEIAKALSLSLQKYTVLHRHDAASKLAPFKNKKMAEWIDEKINDELKQPGAIDITRDFYGTNRFVDLEGDSYLLPTVIYCSDLNHSLAFSEFMFPFMSIVEIDADQIEKYLDHSLVLTAVTKDENLLQRIKRIRNISRLNFGSIPTCEVDWTQPHEGNLFEFLYERRSYQVDSSIYKNMSTKEILSAGSRLISGVGSVQLVGEVMKQNGFRRVSIVTDESIKKAGHLDLVTESLKASHIELNVYTNSSENPTESDAENCMKHMLNFRPNALIGLGGGSSLDTAKGANFLLTNGGRMRDYLGYSKNYNLLLPMLAIPTTAGTGSETQSYALISHDETKQKMACGTPSCMPFMTILDPGLTLTQPKIIACMTALDTLGHAIETAVTSKRNFYSSLLSFQSLRFVYHNFNSIFDDPNNTEKRLRLQLGAYYSGLAIENSMLGLVHSLANPLTKYLGLPHGQAVGLVLPYVMEFNLKSEPAFSIYQDLSSTIGLGRDVSAFINQLKSFYKASKFKSIQISDDQMILIIKDVYKQWTLQFNPIRPEETDVKAILERVLHDQ